MTKALTEAFTKAFIVGAGPGDPSLLTLAAVEALKQADVVLYDRLVSDAVLSMCNKKCSKIYVGKEKGRQQEIQGEIFDYFRKYAMSGRTLVRLKGGDPYVFGRGAEEFVELRELGYDVSVIPGISSSIAVPAIAGIPVTVRGISSAFAVITGSGANDDEVDWSKYAMVDTLVILMGVKGRSQIAKSLIELGRPVDEPVAFVQNGSLPNAKTVKATLKDVAEGAVDVEAPAVFVVGQVVRFYDACLNDLNELQLQLQAVA